LGGRVRTSITSFWQIAVTNVPYLFRPKMAKVEPRETVWKIAGGLLERTFLAPQDGQMGLLHPFCRLTRPQFGACPEFPNSFSRYSGE
jgi:hypothetical protein